MSVPAVGPNYGTSRQFALSLLNGLRTSPSIAAELLAAIDECFRRYDTGPYENRFIVGAVVEQLLGATARSLGLQCENAGARRQAYDLELAAGYGLSVKYTSETGRSDKVRLTNSQGRLGAWNTGTLFVVAGYGVGYADDDLVPGITMPASDKKSLEVALTPLLRFWGATPPATLGKPPAWLTALPVASPDPRYFYALAVPARSTVRSPRLAGDPIALDILQSGRSQTLFNNFKWSI